MAESRSLLAAEFLPRQKLRIVNQIGDVIAGSLAQLPDGQIEAASRDGAPWQVGDAEVLLTGPSAGWRAAPAQPPEGWPHDLRWVQIASSGTDGFPDWLFDVPNVTTGRGLTAGAIAEYVFAAIFDDLKNLAARQAHGPADYRAPDVLTPLGTLEGKTLGLAGFGAIGEAVAKRAIAFGLVPLVYRQNPESNPSGVRSASTVAELFAASDIVVLALPHNEETHHCVDRRTLEQTKQGLHLINVARGGLIDQNALRDALDTGRVRLASLDVTDPEPLPSGHWLYTHPSVRLTPHISWSGGRSKERLTALIGTNYHRYLAGEPLLNQQHKRR
ncbi:NAD(P)-dependent oxidoreductase [Asaia astilbis]